MSGERGVGNISFLTSGAPVMCFLINTELEVLQDGANQRECDDSDNQTGSDIDVCDHKQQ